MLIILILFTIAMNNIVQNTVFTKYFALHNNQLTLIYLSLEIIYILCDRFREGFYLISYFCDVWINYGIKRFFLSLLFVKINFDL